MFNTSISKHWLLCSALVAAVVTLLALVAQAGPLPADAWLKAGMASSRFFYAVGAGLAAFVVAVFVTGQAGDGQPEGHPAADLG